MDKVCTWDVLLKFQKFSRINKYLGTTTRKIKDGEFCAQWVWRQCPMVGPFNLCLIGESKWKNFFPTLRLAYNFNWLINLSSVVLFPLASISCCCAWCSNIITRSHLNSYEVKYSPTKYIDTTERGLVVVSVNEGDAGHYDCYLGGSLLCSYSITVDAHRWVTAKATDVHFSLRRHLFNVKFSLLDYWENCNKSNWIFSSLSHHQMYTSEQRQWLSENLLRLVSRIWEIQIGHEDVGEETSSK